MVSESVNLQIVLQPPQGTCGEWSEDGLALEAKALWFS